MDDKNDIRELWECELTNLCKTNLTEKDVWEQKWMTDPASPQARMNKTIADYTTKRERARILKKANLMNKRVHEKIMKRLPAELLSQAVWELGDELGKQIWYFWAYLIIWSILQRSAKPCFYYAMGKMARKTKLTKEFGFLSAFILSDESIKKLKVNIKKNRTIICKALITNTGSDEKFQIFQAILDNLAKMLHATSVKLYTMGYDAEVAKQNGLE